MQKECSKCKETKDLALFVRDCSKKGGIRHTCKECNQLYHAEWRKNNLDKRRRAVKKWDSNNKEKINKAKRRRRRDSPDKTREESKKRMIKQRAVIGDKYVRDILRRRGYSLEARRNEELIEITRLIIKLKRIIKNKKQ
jgi:hypothetical protein